MAGDLERCSDLICGGRVPSWKELVVRWVRVLGSPARLSEEISEPLTSRARREVGSDRSASPCRREQLERSREVMD